MWAQSPVGYSLSLAVGKREKGSTDAILSAVKLYVVIGGLTSVIYTDIIQLFCLVGGLVCITSANSFTKIFVTLKFLG